MRKLEESYKKSGVEYLAFQRSQRVAEEMKREIAKIFRDELKDPRIGFVTITGVEVTRDLRYGKVFVSVFGDETEKEKTMEVLKNASGFIRKEIGNRIKLRYAPEIIFHIDNSIEHGTKISQLLNRVYQEGSMKDG